jgi:hypothetical protein
MEHTSSAVQRSEEFDRWVCVAAFCPFADQSKMSVGLACHRDTKNLPGRKSDVQ